MSSTEAKFKALALTIYEVLWMQRLLCELSFKLPSTPLIYYDNISVGYLVENYILHLRTKHIENDFHFIHKKISFGVLTFKYTLIKEHIIDAMTKALPIERFQ